MLKFTMPNNVATRAAVVLEEIMAVKDNMADNILDLGELLSEVKANSYHEQWGAESFVEWVEQSGLDIGPRNAYYLIKIVDTAKDLGIRRDALRRVKISKLKSIFSLNPDTDGDKIKQLVAEGDANSLEQVKDAVEKVKAQDDTWEPSTWRNFHLLQSQATVVDDAIEKAKKESGDTVNAQTGEVCDISSGTALERIAADFLATPTEADDELEHLMIEATTEENK